MRLECNHEDATWLITHPDIYTDVSDDSSLPPNEYEVHPDVTALVVYDPEPVACSILYPRNGCSYEIHTQTLPAWRGNSLKYNRAMLAWIWENMPVERLIATIPEWNKRALKHTMKLGFEVEGICPKSFMKDGILMNQTHIGLGRPKEA